MAVRFEGGPEVAAKLAELSKKLGQRTSQEALELGAERMRVAMVRNAPRRPPHPDMADHIVTSPLPLRAGETAAVAIGPDKRFSYGLFVELGTVHQAARPFLRPAFDSQRKNALDIIRESFWAVLSSVGVSRPGGLV